MLRRVFLHGPLRVNEDLIEVPGDTIYEVLEGLSRILPPSVGVGRTRIAVVGCSTDTDLHLPLGDKTEIHVLPQLVGGKNALTQIIVGALLIGLSFVNPIAGMAKLSAMLMQMGAATVLGGIAMALSPTPIDDNNADRSKYLGSPKNTTAIGTRIPILYGRNRWGGHILSFDINAIEFRGTGAGGSSGGK